MPWDGTCTAKEWKALLEKNKGSKFKYEVDLKRLQTLDEHFTGPPSGGADSTFSITVCVADDGVTSCDDQDCPGMKVFGSKPTTRAEFSTAKHVLVHAKHELNPPKAKERKLAAPAPNVPKGTAKDPLFGSRARFGWRRSRRRPSPRTLIAVSLASSRFGIVTA